MVDFILHALRSSPEIAVFLAIASGVFIGRVQIGSFHLGSVAGALLMGLIIGQIGLDVPHELQSVFFVLFIYAVGFKSGPEFFGSLNRGTLKLVVLSIVLCGTALASILLMYKIFDFDAGFTAGLGAGALTDTAIMGTASSAINQLGLDSAARDQLNSHMAVAYAITYLFGTIGLIVFIGSLAPKLLGVDLKASARELERELGIANDDDAISISYTRIVVRAHRVAANSPAHGRTIADIEKMHPDMSVERVARSSEIIERSPDVALAEGDIVGVYALREAVGLLSEWFGPEVDHPESLSFPTRQVDVVFTASELVGKTIQEIKALLVNNERMGCFLNSITRQDYDLPLLPHTVLRRGDVISITGRTSSVEALAARLGRVRERNYKSDIAMHTLGMVVGSLLGLLSTHIGMIPVELGIGGGVLVTALVIGCRAVGILRAGFDGVRCSGGSFGGPGSYLGDAGAWPIAADIWGGSDFAAAAGGALLWSLCAAFAPDDFVWRIGWRTNRSGVDEQDHRAVRQQYPGDRFHRVLRHIQRAVGRMRAHHHFYGGLTARVNRRLVNAKAYLSCPA
jgi:putative transport protein